MKNLQSQIQQKDKKIQDLQRHLTISAKPKEDLVQRQLSNQNISTGVSHPKSNGRVEKGTSSSSHGLDTFRLYHNVYVIMYIIVYEYLHSSSVLRFQPVSADYPQVTELLSYCEYLYAM